MRSISVFALFYTFVILIEILLFATLVEVRFPGVLSAMLYFVPFAIFNFILSFFALKSKKKTLNVNDFFTHRTLIKSIFLISILALIFQIKILITEYGSFESIVFHANDVRNELIGLNSGLFPAWIGYAFSFSYFGLALSTISNQLTAFERKLFTFAIFIVILMFDLTTFGRVGTIFSVFILISSLVYNIGFRSLFRLKYLIFFLFFFSISNLARLLRGSFDNFENSMDFKLKVGLENFPILNGFIVASKYHIQSFFTFDFALQSDFDFQFGQRNFLPFFNILSRLTGGGYTNRIDKIIQIPFDANIYGVQWDFYYDFGIIGISIIPILWGAILIYFLNGSSAINIATGIVLFAGYLFWPIFNVFSFGGMFITLIFGVLLSFINTIKKS